MLLNSNINKTVKRKRTQISLETKLEIIEKSKDSKFKSSDLAKEYGLPISTISTIINPKNQEKIET